MVIEFINTSHSQSIESGGLENFRVLKNEQLNDKIKLNSNTKNFENMFKYNKSFSISEESGNSVPSLFFSANGGYLKEIEENYNTSSIYQKYAVSKTFSEKFNLGLIFRLEYSKREEVDLPDQNRWFDNTTLNVNYSFNPFNNVSAFGGFSVSDTTFTTYGIKYNSLIETEDFLINNTLTFSDDYFYYWNQVAQVFVSDNISFNYDKLNINGGVFFGVVDYNYIENYEAKARNPNTMFSIDAQYLIVPDPVIRAGISFNSRNYKYASPLYYSPGFRTLTGCFTNLYKTFGKIYIYLGGGINVDNQNLFIWSVDSEIGYDYNEFSASAGISRFNDPFYTNYNTFINFTKNF